MPHFKLKFILQFVQVKLRHTKKVVLPSFWNMLILGDPGAVSQVGRKGGTKVFKYGQKSPWVPTLTELFPKIQPDAGSWLGTKRLCIIVPNWRTVSPEFFSWVRTRRLLFQSRLVWLCTQSGNFQFDIKSPSNFKILFARKLKTLFQSPWNMQWASFLIRSHGQWPWRYTHKISGRSTLNGRERKAIKNGSFCNSEDCKKG